MENQEILKRILGHCGCCQYYFIPFIIYFNVSNSSSTFSLYSLSVCLIQHHSFYDFIVTKARGKSGKWAKKLSTSETQYLDWIMFCVTKSGWFCTTYGVKWSCVSFLISLSSFFRSSFQLWCPRRYSTGERCHCGERWGEELWRVRRDCEWKRSEMFGLCEPKSALIQKKLVDDDFSSSSSSLHDLRSHSLSVHSHKTAFIDLTLKLTRRRGALHQKLKGTLCRNWLFVWFGGLHSFCVPLL